MTSEVERGIAGGDEKVGPNLSQLAGDFGAKQAGVGFLNEIVHIRQSGKPSTQISPECRFVGLHFGREPLRMIRGDNLTES